ncbi:Bgt-4250 [Blumeria graminis f. sp. tritici]|uniref:Bgt-4250 n=2 Tax=Blumeria graminis f. sp. tritici TaxID=62690 RepID=A0A061HKA9_BLUGR|nr:hypothetical protein BGT96224_4250 [Blumeria graminis f. sp. tritici 96224]VCU41115.1 Bgt-4250 [Blumeria graminis f. sp. tritici]
MPRPKNLLPTKKKSKHKAIVPSTIDEYLAAGVEFEEAGEKWRCGDVEKSIRFFMRALNCYSEALTKFPSAFDLAYNKARLQYELTQHPKIIEKIPGTLNELLKTSLEYSRYALALKSDSPDILFIVEDLDGNNESCDTDPVKLLEEALVLFQKCLHIQENMIHEQKIYAAEIEGSDSSMDKNNEEGGVSIATTIPTPTSKDLDQCGDRWARVVEPVTQDTLLDTVLASIETLTSLSQLINPQNSEALFIVQKYASSITSKLEDFLTNKGRISEALITRASFQCAFATAQFRCSHIDLSTFSRVTSNAYSDIDLSASPRGLCECAESFISYNTSLRQKASDHNDEILHMRWKALTWASEHLTAASKLSTAENIERIHLTRGDVELLRYQLGQVEGGISIAKASSTVLLRNAGKFYRGSASLARNKGMQRVAAEAALKATIVLGLVGELGGLEQADNFDSLTLTMIEEAIEDGLVTSTQLMRPGVNIIS